MNDSSLILYLFVATFAAVLVVAIFQIVKLRKAKREHHHSALTEGHPEQRDEPGDRHAAAPRGR